MLFWASSSQHNHDVTWRIRDSSDTTATATETATHSIADHHFSPSQTRLLLVVDDGNWKLSSFSPWTLPARSSGVEEVQFSQQQRSISSGPFAPPDTGRRQSVKLKRILLISLLHYLFIKYRNYGRNRIRHNRTLNRIKRLHTLAINHNHLLHFPPLRLIVIKYLHFSLWITALLTMRMRMAQPIYQYWIYSFTTLPLISFLVYWIQINSWAK